MHPTPSAAAALPLSRRLSALLVAGALAVTAAAQTLTFTAIGTGNFGSDTAVRIEGASANGTAVGTSFSAGGTQTAVTWTAAGGFSSLGLTVSGETSRAHAISPDGTYVLVTRLVPGEEDTVSVPSRWTSAGGAVTLTNTIGGVALDSYQVNNGGTVATRSEDSGNIFHATLWTSGGGSNQISSLGSAALGLNNAGAVVGTAASGSDQVAFFWTSGGGLQSLGTLGGANSFAQRVNASGLVAGWAEAAGNNRHVFTWTSGGGMVDLGAYADATLSGLNASGDLVFSALDSGTGYIRPYYYASATGTVYNLASTLSGAGVVTDMNQDIFATGLSDSGQIVGFAVAQDSDGGGIGYQITVSAVPEPSTYAAWAGLAALGLAAWRRRPVARG